MKRNNPKLLKKVHEEDKKETKTLPAKKMLVRRGRI